MENNKVAKEIKKNKDKLKTLFNKIIFILLIFIFLSSILYFSINYSIDKKKLAENELKVLGNNNSLILVQIRDIVNKSLMAKNFILKWEKDFSSAQKILNGINIPEIKKILEELVIKNSIINFNVDFSPVIAAQDAFQKANVTTYTTLISITFNTITDINIYNFLNDLKTAFPGFIVIQEVNIKRTKKVDETFLKTLSTMNIVPAVDGEIKLRLYSLKQN